ncbi:hypothetical protein WDU94_015545 [Cyamophila willieti]
MAETEVELTVVRAKKEQAFSSIQSLYDVSRNILSGTNATLYKKRIGTLDVLYKEYLTLCERCSILELTLKPTSKITFTDLSTGPFHEKVEVGCKKKIRF